MLRCKRGLIRTDRNENLYFKLSVLEEGSIFFFLTEAKAYMNHHFSVGGAQLLSCV